MQLTKKEQGMSLKLKKGQGKSLERRVFLNLGVRIFKAFEPRVIWAMLTLYFSEISLWVRTPSNRALIIK